MLKITGAFILIFFIQDALSQETKQLKFTHFDVSFERSIVKDLYTSVDYLIDYTDNSSNFYRDSLYYSAVRPNNKFNFLPDYHYNRNQFSVRLGFTPNNNRRELNLGLGLITAKQTSFRSFESTFTPIDTLMAIHSNGDTSELFRYRSDEKESTYNLSTTSLFISTEYLFKTQGSCVQFFIGGGVKIGYSISEKLERYTAKESYLIINDPVSQLTFFTPFTFYEPLNPYWEDQYEYELLYTKKIFYFEPYIPFGWNIAFSQKENWLNHIALNVRACAGIEVQTLKRSTLFTRAYVSAGVGLRYTI